MTGHKFDPKMMGRARGLPPIGGVPQRPTVLPGMSGHASVPINTLPMPKPGETYRDARSLDGQPIGIVPDFITEAERLRLLKFASGADAPWERYLPQSDVWYDRMINPRSMPGPILKLMAAIRKRAAKAIRMHYGISEDVYADTLQLVRWRPGDNQKPHADCMEPDGRPNRTPWRAFASIIYLNDEYEGGGIYFPDRQLKPEIEPRMLAFFPSTNNYRHGVEAVTSGLRYTISTFYTFDPAHHDGNPI